MYKRLTTRKLAISILLLIVTIILYNYPSNLKKTTTENKTSINIYIPNTNNYVSLTQIKTKKTTNKETIKKIITCLTINSKCKMNKKFKKIIPQNTTIKSIEQKDNIIKLNFSKELLKIKNNNSKQLIESIVYSITENIPNSKIIIFVEDEKLLKYPNTNIPLDTYLTRDIGINKKIDINTFKNIDKFTIYYKNNNNYYIPITYYKNNVNDKVKIIIENIKTKPLNNSGIVNHLNNQLELINYEIENDNLYVYFNKNLYNITNKDLIEETKYTLYYSLKDSLNINNLYIFKNSNKINEFILEK